MTLVVEILVPNITALSSLNNEFVYWIMCGDRVPEIGCGLWWTTGWKFKYVLDCIGVLLGVYAGIDLD
jgi:hypothetical protein